ncbi:MAG: porin, partial [Vicinamibacterales bacterium]
MKSNCWAVRLVVVAITVLLDARPGSGQSTQPAGEPAEAGGRTGPISGYMDFHFNKEEGQDAILDFHRFVLLFNHSFTPRIRFVGELELEHALVEGLEEAGELELEQAYVDFLLSRPFNVRAGMMLVPLGIINERHEPPVFNGVERPLVDTVIIPSTWFEVGAGIHGEVGRGLRYRAFAMAPLDSLEFSA